MKKSKNTQLDQLLKLNRAPKLNCIDVGDTHSLLIRNPRTTAYFHLCRYECILSRNHALGIIGPKKLKGRGRIWKSHLFEMPKNGRPTINNFIVGILSTKGCGSRIVAPSTNNNVWMCSTRTFIELY